MAKDISLKCPVCKARFRSAVICPRCEADLTMEMRTVAKAFLLRQSARKTLIQGDLVQSLNLIRKASRQKKELG